MQAELHNGSSVQESSSPDFHGAIPALATSQDSPGENPELIVIDGSYGEGGGQIFRTTLSLAMCLRQAVRIENIRGGRKKPGLLRQHLTALRAAQQVCHAKVTGAELKSMTVTFLPRAIKAGTYTCDIGSAGSTTLVLQTLLPALLQVWHLISLIYPWGGGRGCSGLVRKLVNRPGLLF